MIRRPLPLGRASVDQNSVDQNSVDREKGGPRVTNDRRIGPGPALALALLVSWGCGGESQEGSSGEAEAPSWSVEATPSPGKEGARPENPSIPPPSREIPADFPVDVPQYPDADVQAARKAMGSGMSISLQSSDDVDKVAGFYADGFAAQGWATDIRRTADGHAIFADKEGRRASALVRPGADGTGSRVEVVIVLRPGTG